MFRIKPKKISSYFALLLFFGVVCCTPKSKSGSESFADYDQWFNRVVNLPSSNQIVRSDTLPYNSATNFKIVHYINAECPKCLISLEDWKPLIEELHPTKIDFLFFVYATDYDAVQAILADIQFSYPVIYDRDNVYVKLNVFPDVYAFRTLLLDEANRIQLIGDPTVNSQIRELYLKVLHQ